jgi:hypothetical protein
VALGTFLYQKYHKTLTNKIILSNFNLRGSLNGLL